MNFDRSYCRFLALGMFLSMLFAASPSYAFFIAEPQNESEYRQAYALTTNAERTLSVQLKQCATASRNHECLAELQTLSATICNIKDTLYDYDACAAKQQACTETRTTAYNTCLSEANAAYNNTSGIISAQRALTDTSDPTTRTEALDEIYWCQTYHRWSCQGVTEANTAGECATLEAACSSTPEYYLKTRLEKCARGRATQALTQEQSDKCVRNANLNYNNSERRIRMMRDLMDASTDNLVPLTTNDTTNEAVYYQLAPDAPAADQVYVGDDSDALSNTICSIIRLFLGPTGRAIASLGIVFMGIGIFFGKTNWGSALVVSTCVMAMYGSVDIVQWFTGYRACSVNTAFYTVNTTNYSARAGTIDTHLY